MTRRGQVTLFILIGVLVVIGAIVVVINLSANTPDAYIPEAYSSYSDIALDECLEEEFAESLKAVGLNAGYREPVRQTLEDQGLTNSAGTPYALLRPDGDWDGYIIDDHYLEPATTHAKNRYGTIKLLPVTGPISIESSLEQEALERIQSACSFDDGSGPAIQYESINTLIGDTTASFQTQLRHKATGTLETSEHTYDVRLFDIHRDLLILLESMTYFVGHEISENAFSAGLDYAWESSSRTLTLTDEGSELNGDEFAFRVALEERFPLFTDLRCTSGNPHLVHPDSDVNPDDRLVSATCDGDRLEEAVIETIDGEQRTITGVLSI